MSEVNLGGFSAMLLSQELKTSRFRDKFGVEGAVEAIHREKIGNCATSRHFHLCFLKGACLQCCLAACFKWQQGSNIKRHALVLFWEGGALKSQTIHQLDQVPTRIWGAAEGGSAVVWLQVALE